MKKRLLAILLIVVSLIGSMMGCTVEGDDQNAADFGNRSKKITMSYYLAGYGSEHWSALARDYMTNYEDEYYVEMVGDDNSATMRTRITTGNSGADIVQLSVDMQGQTTSIENLTSLYEMTALGEESSGVKIKEKNPDGYNYYKEIYGADRKEGYFRMASGGNTGGYTFAYNKTTLDELFGKDNYTLPVTTKEFFKFGDDMLDKGGFLMSTSLGEVSGDYTVYLTQLWFAQLMGAEDYYHYYNAEYFDETKNAWVLAEDAPRMINASKQELIDAYEALNELFIGENNYLHPESDSLNHLFNNRVFSGAGYGLSNKKTGFLYIGSWLESEMRTVEGALKDQVYGAIKTPIVSDIVNYLEYENMSDATLAAIIRAIDAGKTYEEIKAADGACPNLSKNDYDRLYEARMMIVTIKCSEIVVPKIKDEGKREQIYKFLRYLASDRAQVVAANAKGGINMMAYGAPVKDEDLTITRSLFVQNMTDIAKNSVVIDTAHVNGYTVKYLPISTVYVQGGGNLAAYLCKKTKDQAQTPESMYNNLLANASGQIWTKGIETYKTTVGLI